MAAEFHTLAAKFTHRVCRRAAARALAGKNATCGLAQNWLPNQFRRQFKNF
jgi:hypothetical protein